MSTVLFIVRNDNFEAHIHTDNQTNEAAETPENGYVQRAPDRSRIPRQF